jgi:hypothetical protein
MTLTPDHEIVLVPSQAGGRQELVRQGCYNVRINVFHREQGFPLEAEIDELRVIQPAAAAAASYCGQGLCLFPRLHTD